MGHTNGSHGRKWGDQDFVGTAGHHVPPRGRQLVHANHQPDALLPDAQQLSRRQAVARHRAWGRNGERTVRCQEMAMS